MKQAERKGGQPLIQRLLIAAAVCSVSAAATAAPIILADSLSPTAGSPSALFSQTSIARDFRNTLSSAVSLSSIDLPLYSNSGGVGLTVSLFSDLAGNPGSSLVTLTATTPIPATATQNRPITQFVPTIPTTLTADTIYWVVVTAGPSNSYNWSHRQAAVTASGPGFLPDVRLNTGSGWNAPPFPELALRVTVADSVPELSPASSGLSLVLAGTLFALLSSRRPQRAQHF